MVGFVFLFGVGLAACWALAAALFASATYRDLGSEVLCKVSPHGFARAERKSPAHHAGWFGVWFALSVVMLAGGAIGLVGQAASGIREAFCSWVGTLTSSLAG